MPPPHTHCPFHPPPPEEGELTLQPPTALSHKTVHEMHTYQLTIDEQSWPDCPPPPTSKLPVDPPPPHDNRGGCILFFKNQPDSSFTSMTV